MGWFFSNLHVRKTAGLDSDGLRAALTEILSTQGYQMQNNPNEADLSFSIYDSDGKWVSVCSDGFDFFTQYISTATYRMKARENPALKIGRVPLRNTQGVSIPLRLDESGTRLVSEVSTDE